jgi:DNA-directed RNA polymerase subunit L
VVEGDGAGAVRFAAYAVVHDQDDPYAKAIRTLVEHSQELDQTVQALRAKLDRLERELAEHENATDRLRAVK